MTPGDEDDGLDLRHYLGVFRRRWWIIAACVAVTAASALAASLLQTSVYEAHSTLLIQQRTGDTLFDPNTGQAGDPQCQNGYDSLPVPKHGIFHGFTEGRRRPRSCSR